MRRTHPRAPSAYADVRSERQKLAAGDGQTRGVVPGLQAAATVTNEDVRLLAYLKWEASGKPIGHDLFFWTEAERELLHRS